MKGCGMWEVSSTECSASRGKWEASLSNHLQ
jgi:hypothetical protein